MPATIAAGGKHQHQRDEHLARRNAARAVLVVDRLEPGQCLIVIGASVTHPSSSPRESLASPYRPIARMAGAKFSKSGDGAGPADLPQIAAQLPGMGPRRRSKLQPVIDASSGCGSARCSSAWLRDRYSRGSRFARRSRPAGRSCTRPSAPSCREPPALRGLTAGRGGSAGGAGISAIAIASALTGGFAVSAWSRTTSL